MNASNCSKCAFIVSILILAGLLASCGSGTTAVSTVADPNLMGSVWQLVSINDKPLQGDTLAVIAFGEVGNVMGSTGCNLFVGTYSLGSGDVLNFKPYVTTSIDCTEPYLAQEKSILLVLSSSSNYTIEGDELRITNPDGERRGFFVRKDPFPLDGTSWKVDAFNNGRGVFVNLISGTEITASFTADDEMSGSGGCNEYNSTYQVDGMKIDIGPTITTQMTCSEPAGVMEQEIKYLQALDFAKTYRNFGIILVFYDAEGQVLANYVSSDLQRSP